MLRHDITQGVGKLLIVPFLEMKLRLGVGDLLLGSRVALKQAALVLEGRLQRLQILLLPRKDFLAQAVHFRLCHRIHYNQQMRIS